MFYYDNQINHGKSNYCQIYSCNNYSRFVFLFCLKQKEYLGER